MSVALSELSVTEFLTLARAGFLPRGLVVGSAVLHATTPYNWSVSTAEITGLSRAMRTVRLLAVQRLRKQAAGMGADGIVDVRIDIEHHLWRGQRQVARCLALGTAVVFDRDRAPEALRQAPSLRLKSGQPFDSDLSGSDFITLLHAGYRPISVAMGCCVYGLDPRDLRAFRDEPGEVVPYTRAFLAARELAMERLQQDLFKEHPHSGADAPTGIVGMSVHEEAHGGKGASGVPIVEFTALGTAVAPLAADDPRRATGMPTPTLVVALDR